MKGIPLKQILFIISLFVLAACSKEEVQYDGTPLTIAVVGDIPEINNENIHFKPISLEELSVESLDRSTDFDAVMITPVKFEEASDDQFVEVYTRSKIPIIFFNSTKRHYPFTREGATYETAHWEALNNGSHTTIYLADKEAKREDAWFFFLKGENELDVLYKEIFQKVEML